MGNVCSLDIWSFFARTAPSFWINVHVTPTMILTTWMRRACSGAAERRENWPNSSPGIESKIQNEGMLDPCWPSAVAWFAKGQHWNCPVAVAGTTCKDVSAIGSRQGHLGPSTHPLAIWMSERFWACEDVMVHECTTLFFRELLCLSPNQFGRDPTLLACCGRVGQAVSFREGILHHIHLPSLTAKALKRYPKASRIVFQPPRSLGK